ncbi:MAG: hypothetical protein MUF15_11030 [Acidobacteria bacterium]|jgi:tetratricopeptide (TPR) repeat protein|nr:hypothetical protein [Acidobacteriota bacterium]
MKEKGKKTLVVMVFLVIGLFSCIQLIGQDADSKPTLAEVDALMVDKTVENSEKAIKGYELLLKDDPNNVEILYKLADAYTCILDIKTDGFLVEKDEFKPILKSLGKTANDYAHKAYKLNPNSKEVAAATLRAHAYYSASFGVVKAVFSGAAGHFKDLANQLIKMDEKFKGAIGYRFLGKFYHVAPWPAGSESKALKYFKKAIETDNETLYSHYFAGLLYFKDKEWDLAEKEFAFVRDNPPTNDEAYYFEAYKKSANDYLAKIAAKKK